MQNSVEKIIQTFPHPTLSPILGQPAYASISALHLKLNTNAASVPSHLGNGQLGLLFLTVSPAVYNTQSAIEFVPPENPGQEVLIPENSTAAQITSIHRLHDIAAKHFAEYTATDKALKTLLLSAIDETYVRALRDRYIGYANVTTLTLITHLYTAYARISQGDLDLNHDRLRTPWDPNQPFETVISQVEDAVEYAAAGNTPYSPAQVVTHAYNLVNNTGLFADDCKLWRRKPLAERTWANFRTDFTLAHQELRESSQTAHTGGFQANNIMETAHHQADTVTAIANLATATASDKATIESLTTTNASLTAALISLNKQLSIALRASQPTNPRPGPSLGVTGLNKHYCWTHGTYCPHSSYKCEAPAPGHKNKATTRNKQGGATNTYLAPP